MAPSHMKVAKADGMGLHSPAVGLPTAPQMPQVRRGCVVFFEPGSFRAERETLGLTKVTGVWYTMDGLTAFDGGQGGSGFIKPVLDTIGP